MLTSKLVTTGREQLGDARTLDELVRLLVGAGRYGHGVVGVVFAPKNSNNPRLGGKWTSATTLGSV